LRGAAAALATRASDHTEQVFSFKAPLLNRLLDNSEDPERREVVLDLGRASQSLLDRLIAARPCRVEVADLATDGGLSSITEIDSNEADDRSADRDLDRIRGLLPEPSDEQLNLILCWDLPNYLTLSALSLLIDSLSNRIAPGCHLHMLIGYSKREMAAQPGRYIPGTDGNLSQILPSDELAQAPRYSPEHLGSALGNFGYERGVLLANGMQEFIYAWPDDEPSAERSF